MEEIWKDVIGYESLYKVSNDGRVWSVRNNSEIGGYVGGSGYVYVTLYKKGIKRKTLLVHRLVAQAFICNDLGVLTINHKDANKSNNRLDNLDLCTQKENVHHAINKGLWKTKTKHQTKEYKILSKEKANEIREKYLSYEDIGKLYGLNYNTVAKILKGTIYKDS